MRGTEVYRLLSGAASQATAEANVRFLKQYHHDVDEMFARLHAGAHNPVGSSGYDAEKQHYMKKQEEKYTHTADPHLKNKDYGVTDYTRYSFQRRSEANRFVSEMRKQGVEVTLAPVRIHGELMVEIPREMKLYNDDGTVKKRADGSDAAFQTSTIVRNYEQSSGVKVERYNYADDYGDAKERYTQGTAANVTVNIFENEILGQIPEIAAVARGIEKLDYIAKKYGDTDQKHAFTQTVRHDGAGGAVGERWSGANHNQVKATVLNNEVVIIDGKRVTDPEVLAAVMGHHERRSKLTEHYAQQYADVSQALAWSSATSSAPTTRNSAVTQFRFSDTNERIAANARDIGIRIRNQSYAVGGFEHGAKHGRFDDSVQGEGIGMMRDAFGKEAIMLREKAGIVTITEDMLVVLNKAMLDPNSNFTQMQKDFLQNLSSRISSEGNSVMFTYEDKINMTNLIDSTAGLHAQTGLLTPAEKSLLDSMNDRAENGGQFRLSKEDMTMFSLTTKAELDAIREDLGIDLDFAKNRGRNIGQEHLVHINVSLEKELAKQGITFDVQTAKFTDSSGKALDKDEIIKALASTPEGMRDVLRLNAAQRLLYDKTGNLDLISKNFDIQLDRAGIKTVDYGNGSAFIHNHGVDISEFDILKLDKAFLTKAQAAGFNFVTAAGTLDVKSLMNLSAADKAKLKAVGLSDATIEAMQRFHAKDGNMLQQLNFGGAASWGNSKHILRKKGAKLGKGAVTKLAGGGSRLIGEGDQETQQALQAYQNVANVPRHIRTAAAYTKQAGEAVGMRVDAFKARHAKNQGKASAPRSPVKTKKNKASTRAVNEQKVAQKIARDEKRLARMNASKLHMEKLEKILHRFDVKGRAMEYLATKTVVGQALSKAFVAVKGFIIKVVGLFFLIYFTLAAAFLLVMVIISMIQALLDAPYHGMKKVADWYGSLKGEEAAIIELYKYMDSEIQVGWLKDLNNYDTQFKNRNDVRYTMNYTDADAYFAGIDDLYKDGSQLYINPFYKGGNIEKDAMTKVTAYDGKNDTVLMANPSVYGAKNDEGTISTESGHTNNIKDILAMVDVNYQFDINTFSDEGMESILGEKPSVIKFENIYNKVTGFFKWAGKSIVHLFGGDDETEYPKLEDYWGGTVSYGTIQNYCDTLYRASHQEQVSLSTEYYQMKPVEVNINGTVKDVSDKLTQKNASYLDVCNNPVEKKYKLAYGSYIYPYVLDGSGNKIDLSKYSSTASGNVRLAMDYTSTTGHLKEGETPCLWNSMGEDKATYDEITDRIGLGIIGDPCWSRDSKTEDYESYSATSDWRDSKGEAKDEAVNLVKAKSDEYKMNPPAVAKEYTLTADRDAFIRVWKEGCYKHDDVTYEEDDVYDGTEDVDGWWSEDYSGYYPDDHGKGKAYKLYVDGTFRVNADWDNSYYETVNGDIILHYWFDGERTLNIGTATVSHSWNFETYKYTVDKYKKIYRATCTADVICQYTETFKRKCDGHKFVYCGGHIACHMKGMVYSATNEQLAIAGMYTDEDSMPKVKDYVLADHGFETIRGKVIKKEIDYTNPYTASTSGGCKSPVADVQGSDVNRGLNLYVTSGGDFCKDMKFRSDLSPQVFRDIFDIDSAIDKGNNVFPWKPEKDGGKGWKAYEGWTADNIQFVAMKLSIDWNDLYGFDAPLEIGAVTISEKDIDLLNDALAKEYGSNFTDTRKEAVDYALRWVGRGHYSQDHDGHDFLDNVCKSHSIARTVGGKTYFTCYDANCTAGCSADFVDCYLSRFGKAKTTSMPSAKWHTTSNIVFAAYPADIIRHQNVLDFAYKEYPFTDNDVIKKGGTPLRKGLVELRDHDAYQIYIGTLTKIFNEMGVDEIELTNGYIIKKGVPITIDLSPSSEEGLFGLTANGTNGSGTVFFRSENSGGYGETRNTENFYWLQNDSARTKYARFE